MTNQSREQSISSEWLEPISTERNMVDGNSPRAGVPCLLSLLVMGVSSCICLAAIMIAGVTGYNQELDAIQTDTGKTVVADLNRQYILMECDRVTGFDTLADVRATRISGTQAAYFEGQAAPALQLDASGQERIENVRRQYEQANREEARGDFDMAIERYLWIATAQPNCSDALLRIDEINRYLSATPTIETIVASQPTEETPVTTEAPTLEATESPSPAVQPTEAVTDPAPVNTATIPSAESQLESYFGEAEFAYEFGFSEKVIEYLDVIIALDPSYRRNEVDQMLFDSLINLARRYLRGLNVGNNPEAELAGNQLARGIRFAERAGQVQQRNPSVGEYPSSLINYEAYIAAELLQIQADMAAQNYGAAAVRIENLCVNTSTVDCSWGYRGITLQNMLDEARRGGN